MLLHLGQGRILSGFFRVFSFGSLDDVLLDFCSGCELLSVAASGGDGFEESVGVGGKGGGSGFPSEFANSWSWFSVLGGASFSWRS